MTAGVPMQAGIDRGERSMRKQAGFTLMEIMITVVIVAVLAAIAYPIYLHYVKGSRRTSAITALQRAAAAEEKHYATYNRYATSLTTLGYQSNSVDIPSGSQHWYTLKAGVDPSGNSAYELTAAPAGSQTGDACGTYVLTGTGSRSLSGNTKSVEQCWGGG